MAGLARKLYVNWLAKQRIRSDVSNSQEAVSLVFFKYEQVPFEIVILEPLATGANSLVRVDITDLSLRVAISNTLDSATPQAEQLTWTKNTDSNTFSGSLNLNTSAMNSLIGSSSSVSAYFEIEVFDASGNRVKVLSESCSLRRGVQPVVTESPNPAKTYLSIEEMRGLFIPRMLALGENISWRDTAGNVCRTIGTDANGNAVDDGRT